MIPGVNFSDTDDGKVIVKRDYTTKNHELKDVIGRILRSGLDDALRSFSSQPIVWVEPVLCKTNELSRNVDDDTENKVILADFISSPKSTIIKAPPQFGLTCLAHYIAKEAWNLDSFLWLYLDCKDIKSSHRVDKVVKKELKILGIEKHQINGIIVDSWTNLENESLKILKNLSESYKNIPMIVMQTIDDSQFMIETKNETINREFEILYLLALPGGHLRKVVSAYNDKRHIGDEDAVIKKVVSDLEVLNSNLPASVKDQHADLKYDRIRPYDQSIHAILHEYSLVLLMQSIKASSRALRNSDYVNPEIKRELLDEIMCSWEQMSKVFFALTPLLALKGNAVFEGAGFILCGNFGKTFEERIKAILQNIPYNVVSMFSNDLFSNKMGPLLFKQIDNAQIDLIKHELILFLIYNRPRNWKKQVEKYIVAISKNSFFLFDIVNTLCAQYRYSFATPIELNEIEYLIKMGLAKHEFGTKRPLMDKILKISNKALPEREFDDDDV